MDETPQDAPTIPVSVPVVTPVRDHAIEQDRLSTFRRYIFATWTTALNLVIVCVVTYRSDNGLLSQQVVNGAYSYMELMACLLLGASVIDRTRLVDKFMPTRFTGGDDRDRGPGSQPDLRGPPDHH